MCKEGIMNNFSIDQDSEKLICDALVPYMVKNSNEDLNISFFKKSFFQLKAILIFQFPIQRFLGLFSILL